MDIVTRLMRQLDQLESELRKITGRASYRSELTGGVERVLYGDLPTATATSARIYYVTNGRKSGEGAGLGTGVLAIEDNRAWFA